MAHITLVRPRYRSRGVVALYLTRGQIVARAWRRPGPDPKTARQLAQRARMTCASGFLKHFASIVSRGYQPGSKPNGRAVGAYQMALSQVMLNHTIYNRGVWRIDYAKVRLAQGRSFPLRGLTIKRTAGRLALRWHGRAPRAVHLLRVALYDPKRGECCILAVPLPPGSTTAAMKLPKGWGNRSLHAWLVLEDSQGRILYESHYPPLMGPATSTATSLPGGTVRGSIIHLPPSTTFNVKGGLDPPLKYPPGVEREEV